VASQWLRVKWYRRNRWQRGSCATPVNRKHEGVVGIEACGICIGKAGLHSWKNMASIGKLFYAMSKAYQRSRRCGVKLARSMKQSTRQHSGAISTSCGKTRR